MCVYLTRNNIVAIVSNATWDSSRQVLEYNLEQSYSQQGTNIFPSNVKRRARKEKGTTLKLKKCAFFADDLNIPQPNYLSLRHKSNWRIFFQEIHKKKEYISNDPSVVSIVVKINKF